MISAGGEAVKTRIAALEAKIAALESPERTGKRFEYTLVPIRQALVRSAPVKTWLDEYKGSLKALNLQAGESSPSWPGNLDTPDWHNVQTATKMPSNSGAQPGTRWRGRPLRMTKKRSTPNVLVAM